MKDKRIPTYITVPRKLIIVWGTTYLCMLIMTIASIQWANYVDRRSNQRWCGVIVLFDDTYKKSPPPTEVGKILASEFTSLRKEFKCK